MEGMEEVGFSFVIYVLFAALALVGIKREKVKTEGDYLRKLNYLRGIFAVEIVIGHVVRYENTILYPLGKFMIISVAFFFFVSAMGLLNSFYSKNGYLRHFVFRKGMYLFVIAVLSFVYKLLWYIGTGNKGVSENIFFMFLKETNWYIWELLFFYILFYFTFRYIKKFQIIFILGVTIIMITVAFYAGMMQGYYSSALAFPAGLVFYRYFDRVMKFLKGLSGRVCVIAMILMGISGLFFGEESLIGMVYLRNIMCLASMCVLIYFLENITVDNKVLRCLGKYSLEIYLYQFIFLGLTGGMEDYKSRILLVCCLTGVSAFLMHPVNNWFKERINHI